MNKWLFQAAGWLRGLLCGATPNTGARAGGVPAEAAWGFVEQVMREHHFTAEAREWLRSNVRLRVDDLESVRGGGYWQPSGREVRLFTGQHEAAVHEMAHAWWHYRRERLKDDMIEATVRLSAEKDARYQILARLAFGYVHGIPEQPWEGLLVTRNDWEMFAGLASGTMGDMRKLPPYVRRLYAGLFEMPGEV
ncbi:MAG TPA: hypothetical protein VEY08_09140 [Chloroflexia bacterium]|nr:hypothetical protein [Chloroflexia bacterium]